MVGEIFKNINSVEWLKHNLISPSWLENLYDIRSAESQVRVPETFGIVSSHSTAHS